jgi:hypothetical protein
MYENAVLADDLRLCLNMSTKRRFEGGFVCHLQARLTRLAALVLVTAVMGSVTVRATTLPENIPDFSLDISRPGVQSAQSGNWSSASTWQGGQVPTANHVVRILPGHTVTINDTVAVAYTVAIDGKLAFATTVNTRLQVTNVEVMAGEMGMGTPGILELGTAANPIAAGVTAEIVIANSPLGGSVADVDQFGTGIVVLGKVSMHGSVKMPTFVRLAIEPRAGNTALTLSEAVSGWKVGDRLVLPDTRHIKESEVIPGSQWINAVNQWEERTVQAISADGKTITLNSALTYDHLGARDLNNVLDFLPHVGNLTRNLIIRSESATGTRGHMLAIHMADVDIRYALFKDMGRTTYLPLDNTTNHIGRYPIHVHHLSGPMATPANGYQFTLVGNAVDGGSVETKFKWGVTVHGSHYGQIQDNVVYNYNGAAVATEDGSESFNVFDHNFALRGMGEPNDAVSEARMAMGTEGVGFWFRGPNNFVRNNVAANYQNSTTEAAYGYAFQFRYLGNIAVPNFKGADTMVASQSTTRDGNNMPILQFENNEAYGAMQGGFTLWWVSSQDPQPYATAQESLIKDLKLWNVYNKAVYMYPSQKITFDGLKIRGNFNANGRCCGNGVYFADYSSKGIVIRNSDIQGMEEGITAPEAGFGPEANLTVLNSYLRNNSNLDVPMNGSVNGCWMAGKLVVAINTRFDVPPGRSPDHIAMVGDVASAPLCPSILDEMRVYAYNGVAADNFQVYHTSASVLPRPPASCNPTTRAGITGLTCPIAAIGAVPTATASISPATIPAGQPATLTWITTNAVSIVVDQGIGSVAASGTMSVFPTATTTYTVTAKNDSATVTAAATVMVTAAADTTPPVISGVTSSALTTTGATIGFTTNEPSYHQIEYGTTTAYGTLGALDSMLMTSHTQPLTGLTAGTQYHYRVRATDAAGSTALSTDFTFTTASVPPLLTATLTSSPASITSGSASTLTWSTTNATSISINQAIGTVSASGTRSVSPTATTTYTLTATNGTSSVTATASVTVTAPAALVITNPAADNLTQTSARITWTTSAAANSRIDYGTTTAYGAFVVDATPVTGHSLSLTGLSPSTTYHYRITSQAGAGAPVSPGDLSFSTSAVPVPAQLIDPASGSNLAASSQTFTWNAGTGVTSYKLDIGTTVGGTNLYAGVAGTARSVQVAGLPINGALVWVRLQSRIGSAWQAADYPFKAFSTASGLGVKADKTDFDRDGKADLAVYRPSTGVWYVKQSSTNYTTSVAYQWGVSTDVAVPGDYDGDGLVDLVLYRPSTGTWYMLLSTTQYSTYIAQQWGVSTDIPVPGDYDGDGKNDLALYRPSTGYWFIKQSSTNYTTYLAYPWGIATDLAVPGDYDGDGKTDLGLYRPSTGEWWVLRSSTNFTTYVAQTWGLPTDIAVPGDYDGDGKTDLGLYRPSTGSWFVKQSSTNYLTNATYQWGVSTDIVVPGDYDGDRRADLALYRPSTGQWFVKTSSSNYTSYFAQQWGLSTDVPVFKRP